MIFNISAKRYTKEAEGFTAVRANTFLFLVNVLDVLV